MNRKNSNVHATWPQHTHTTAIGPQAVTVKKFEPQLCIIPWQRNHVRFKCGPLIWEHFFCSHYVSQVLLGWIFNYLHIYGIIWTSQRCKFMDYFVTSEFLRQWPASEIFAAVEVRLRVNSGWVQAVTVNVCGSINLVKVQLRAFTVMCGCVNVYLRVISVIEGV